MPATSRLAVLLFTDIVGSMELKSRVAAPEFSRLLEQHNRLFESSCGEFRGEILKHTGDGFFAAFNTPSDAVRCALQFEDAMRGASFGHPLAARVGIHVGEVEIVELAGRPDVVGLAADLASRVMGLAAGGQILMTRSAFNDARQFVSDATLRWVAHGAYLFKGLDEPIEVFEVGTDGVAPLTAPTGSEKSRRVVPHDQEPTLGWRPAIGLEVPGRPGWSLERKLGEGGFGEVWLGHHDRTKQCRVFKFCFDADRLRSFKRELTLFRLLRDALGDRPDIARLYEVKLDEPPFFLESEYTEGGNLIEWAERQGGLQAVPPAQRLEIVAQVADAVAAAHSVGVLHKDIKPSNILMHVDAAGTVQPRLSDFGIGMLADKSQLRNRQITETGFTVITENDSSRTGTRLYAPPESILGRPFTVQGDIFALGVLLYQMIVADLHRPLAAGWERELNDEMLREEVAACVDGDPARRIPAAGELAHRLRTIEQRRQERQAVAAASRAAATRRRRLRLSLAISSLSLALSLVAIGLYLRERNHARALAIAERRAIDERNAAVAATIEKDRQRELAERRFGDIRALADTFMFKVHDAIARLPGSTSARNLLVTTAIHYLDGLSREAGADPALQRDLVAGYRKIADIQLLLANTPAALSAAQRSLEIAEALAAANPQDPQTQAALAQSWNGIGNVRAEMHDYPGLLEARRTAFGLYEARHAQSENDVDARIAFLESMRNLGRAIEMTGDYAGAMAMYERSLEASRQWVAAEPTLVAARISLGVSLRRVGDLHDVKAERIVAADYNREALPIFATLLQENPGDPYYSIQVNSLYTFFGDHERKTGNPTAALPWYEKSREVTELFSQADPSNADWKMSLSYAYTNIGDAYFALGRDSDARASQTRALAMRQQLAALDPTSVSAMREVTMSRLRLSKIEARLAQASANDQAAATAHWRASVEHVDDAMRIAKPLQEQKKFRAEDATWFWDAIVERHQQSHAAFDRAKRGGGGEP